MLMNIREADPIKYMIKVKNELKNIINNDSLYQLVLLFEKAQIQ